jgi:hypothetical protein
MKMLKYSGTTLRNQIFQHKEIKCRLNSRNVFCFRIFCLNACCLKIQTLKYTEIILPVAVQGAKLVSHTKGPA